MNKKEKKLAVMADGDLSTDMHDSEKQAVVIKNESNPQHGEVEQAITLSEAVEIAGGPITPPPLKNLSNTGNKRVRKHGQTGRKPATGGSAEAKHRKQLKHWADDESIRIIMIQGMHLANLDTKLGQVKWIYLLTVTVGFVLGHLGVFI